MAFLGGLFSKFYLLAGATILLGYVVVETGGYVFSGTDRRPSLSSGGSSSSSGGRRGGGGVFFFGSGYRGGK